MARVVFGEGRAKEAGRLARELDGAAALVMTDPMPARTLYGCSLTMLSCRDERRRLAPLRGAMGAADAGVHAADALASARSFRRSMRPRAYWRRPAGEGDDLLGVEL